MTPSCTYTVRCSERLSVAEATAIVIPLPVNSEKRSRGCLTPPSSRSWIQVSPSALARNRRGSCPPSTGTTQVSQSRETKRRVGNPRPVWRELGGHLEQVVVRQLHRIPIGQQLDVNLSRPNECLGPPDKRHHAAVRRKSRLRCGVEVGDLGVREGCAPSRPRSGWSRAARCRSIRSSRTSCRSERVSEGLDLLRSGAATKVVITPGAAPAS